MPRILGGVQARALRQLFDDARHVDTRQAARLYPAVAIDRPEQRTGTDVRQLQPGLNRADRARLGI